MEVELSLAESEWTNKFIRILVAMPSSLRLRIDAAGDGNIEIFSMCGTSYSRTDKSWIRKIQSHLREFPATPEFWVLSNIDGWNIGKGKPAFYSGTTVGEGGATGSLSDDFNRFYHFQHEIEHGSIDEAERDECEVTYIKSNLGDLTILNFNQ